MEMFNGPRMKYGVVNPSRELGNQEQREYLEWGRLFMGHTPVVGGDLSNWAADRVLLSRGEAWFDDEQCLGRRSGFRANDDAALEPGAFNKP